MSGSGSFRANEVPDSGIVSGIFLPVDDKGGLALQAVKPGTILEVHTKNNIYTVVPQESGEVLIWGHPEYCPEPTTVSGLGSTYWNGIFREGYLGIGMHLNFPFNGRRVKTSGILSIQAKKRS